MRETLDAFINVPVFIGIFASIQLFKIGVELTNIRKLIAGIRDEAKNEL